MVTRNHKGALDRALMDLSRYEIGTYGHRDARAKVFRVIDEMIDEKIAAAISAVGAEDVDKVIAIKKGEG